MHLYQDQGWEGFYTFEGILSILVFIMPVLLVYEVLRSIFVFKKGIKAFYVSILVDLANRLIGRLISLGVAAYLIVLLKPYALFETRLTWYWFIYSYIVWELGHFIFHYLAHKVRLFWCLHSSHHAPEEMNLSVSYSHFFLEAAFTDSIRVTVCILLGVSPVMLAMVALIDWFWAELNHISEDTWKNARMGWLGKYILTPSHHRVHHSRNDLYLDKNFGNLLPIWDRVFRTYQEELPEVKPEYGITRPMNSHNFWDVYFGEILALVKDVYRAPGLKNKLLYLIMPPGWSHTGKSKMVKDIRKEVDKAQPVEPTLIS
jgi:sterol desaturase/sphingolipid hydroxylase (fatty acid hydroxylase superfamily)